jgi:hypothetical protein
MVAAGRIVVAPLDDTLLARVKPAPTVIHLRHPRQVDSALDCAVHRHLNVHGLWIETHTPLCAIDLRARWREAAIALFAPAAGTFQEFRSQIARLRPLRIRVCLPATSIDNVLAVRILASFGVRAAVILRPPIACWDAVTDLMNYALGSPRHAPIEPFDFIARHGAAAGNYSTIYFDDPSTYVHVDADGRVAATPDDLRAGRFVADRIEDVTADDLQQTRTPIGACIHCSAWPVCRGRFEEDALQTDHCRRFFSELLDVVSTIHRRPA